MVRTTTTAAIAVGALAAMTGSAGASMFTIAQSQGWSFPLSPGQATLVFDQFDDLDGARQLKEVRIDVDAAVSASATGENDSKLPAPDFTLSLSGNVSVSVASGFMETFAIFNRSQSVALMPSDGVEASGADYHDFGMFSDDESTSMSTTDDFLPFIGTGTIMVDILGSAGFSLSGSTDATLSIDDLMGSGVVTITYTFLPSPGTTITLGGVAAVAMIRRRR